MNVSLRFGAGAAVFALAVACSPTEVPDDIDGDDATVDDTEEADDVAAEDEDAAADDEEAAADADEVEEREGDGVRFLIAENFWADWVPYQSTAQSQQRLNVHLYDTLVQFPTGELDQPEPMLATDWEQIDDTTWEFTLRDDVTFHEGQALTAEDVVASVERASGAAGEDTVLADRWVPTTGEVVDDHTVRLVTDSPLATLFDALRQTPIIAAEDAEAGADTLAERPNGTGPFRLTDETETRKDMEVNEDYWDEVPEIEELTWEFVGDAQTRVNALLAGQADAIDRVPAEHHDTIESEDGFTLQSMTGIEQVNLLTVPGRWELWDDDLELRQAVTMAIDRDAIVENLVQGESQVAGSFMPSEVLYYQQGEPDYQQDLDAASELIQEIGAEGEEVELWVASGFLPRAEQVGEAVVANLNEIGLDAELVTTDVAGLVDDAHGDGTGSLYHLSWSSSGDPAAALGIWGSEPWSDGSDETVQELLAAGMEVIDEDEREEIYVDLQAHFWEQLPHVPMYYSDFSVAHTDELEDLRVLPNFETNFTSARLSD
jgi:peptide/nickel transport system substrate-binding protein